MPLFREMLLSATLSSTWETEYAIKTSFHILSWIFVLILFRANLSPLRADFFEKSVMRNIMAMKFYEFLLQVSFIVNCHLMYSIIIIMFGWKLCSKFIHIMIVPILANFVTLLDHTKGNADLSKIDVSFLVYFYILESTCLGLLAYHIWLLFLLPVKS